MFLDFCCLLFVFEDDITFAPAPEQLCRGWRRFDLVISLLEVIYGEMTLALDPVHVGDEAGIQPNEDVWCRYALLLTL
jgi:hypothetical protein